jgi:hypothetical protein
MASVRLDGLKDLQKALAATADQMADATAKGIYDMVNEIAKESSRLVPVDTGALRASRTVDVRRTLSGLGVEAEIAYGGAAAPYAVIQHERLDLWHPPKPPGKTVVGGRSGTGPIEPGQGRGPKYLEHPFTQHMDAMPENLMKRIRAHVRFDRRSR